ncbi:hypothetical protein V2J09_012536 [Rumex salicifolius]
MAAQSEESKLQETESGIRDAELQEENSEFEEDDYDDEDEDDYPEGNGAVSGRKDSEAEKLSSQKAKVESLFRRMSSEGVALRVHDVLIQGNTKTKEFVIEAEIGALRDATTLQELFQAASLINSRLRSLEIFDSVNITLDAGPPELPGTANVVIEVSELKNPLSGDIGVFTKPTARSSSLEGSLKLKNVFGYGDLWDGSLTYGWDQASEMSVGVSLPRLRWLVTPVAARVYLLSQDWLKFSSYKERSLGASIGLLSTRNHDLSYNLTWRTLMDPSQMASSSIRRQLGHNLLSSLKYTFKFDRRNSSLRPTSGYCFAATTQVSGLTPDTRGLRFLRQDVDIRYAISLGYCRAALNFGLAGGLIFPWGRGFLDKPSSLPDRYFMGGNSSPVCSLGGPSSVLGFKFRGLGPTDLRRQTKDKDNGSTSETSMERDVLGGDLAVSAFADLSFDLPVKVLREAGIHAHAFACAGNLTKLTENEFRNFSLQKYLQSFRSSAGFGVVIPTKLFRMEVNYCYILKQFEHDNGKSGLQFSFSSPLMWNSEQTLVV